MILSYPDLDPRLRGGDRLREGDGVRGGDGVRPGDGGDGARMGAGWHVLSAPRQSMT